MDREKVGRLLIRTNNIKSIWATISSIDFGGNLPADR